MDILILGHKGMLGHMLMKYFSDKGYVTHTTDYRFPSKEFIDYVSNWKGDYIINAVGAIPQKTKQFEINVTLPIWLSSCVKTNVIHAGTDCEMDDDEYGISKKSASNFIKSRSVNTKIIKASIIGPELNSHKSLLDWFLNSTDKVYGYSKAMWNGITTLEWAKQCELLINDWNNYLVENIVEGECLSKYDLLIKIKKVFNLEIDIIPNENININKCLKGSIKVPNIEDQLIQLKKYYYEKSK